MEEEIPFCVGHLVKDGEILFTAMKKYTHVD